MELIPYEEIRSSPTFNFAPMIDFLFLMLCLFATLSISRSSLLHTEVELVKTAPEKEVQSHKIVREIQKIHLGITETGTYQWFTEFQAYPMKNLQAIQHELTKQYQIGALSKDKTETEFLLHIDKKAPWEQIMQLIFAIRELGFNVHPVYQPLSTENSKR